MAIAHPNLLKLAMELGLYNNAEGLCHGFTIQWIEACLSGDAEEQRFEKYIAEIASSSPEILASEIKNAKLKSDNAELLSEKEQELLEIYQTVRRICIFHNPSSFSELFKTGFPVLQRHWETVSSAISTGAIQEQGGLKDLYSASFVLNPEEIESYLTELNDLLDFKEEHAEKLNAPVALLLHNAHHAIGLIYKPNQGWSYRNINQDFPTDNTVVRDPAILANFINTAYRNNSPFIAFNARAIRTAFAHENPDLQKKLELFKNSHVINEEIAQRHDEYANLAWIAAASDDKALISKLPQSINLNFQGFKGMTPACMAAQNASPEILSELISKEADVNLPNHRGETPAYIAAKQGLTVIIDILGSKADLDKTTNEENAFPLFAAAQMGFTDTVVSLTKHGASPNQRTTKGATCLIIAAQKGHQEIVQHLIGLNDVDLNAANNSEASAVYVAAQNGHDQIVRLLADKKANLNQPRDNGDTPAIIAVKNKHPAVIRELGSHGADLNQENIEGLTPCLIAVLQEDRAMIKELSAQKADLNAASSSKMFPIFLAAQLGFSEMVDILAEEGANLDQIAHNGATPAMVAAFEGHRETVKALIAHKANFDVSTTDGITPLFMACQQNFPEIVKLLLDIPVDSTIAFRATPAQLRQSIADKGVSAIQKMESLITAQSPDSEGKIKLLPKDIAEILGHQAIVDLFAQSVRLKTEAFFSDSRCFFNQQISKAVSLEPALSSPEQSMPL